MDNFDNFWSKPIKTKTNDAYIVEWLSHLGHISLALLLIPFGTESKNVCCAHYYLPLLESCPFTYWKNTINTEGSVSF